MQWEQPVKKLTTEGMLTAFDEAFDVSFDEG